MKQSEFKTCFDAITPTAEQKESVLASVIQQRATVHKSYSKYLYAAVLVFFVCSVSFLFVRLMDDIQPKENGMIANLDANDVNKTYKMDKEEDKLYGEARENTADTIKKNTATYDEQENMTQEKSIYTYEDTDKNVLDVPEDEAYSKSGEEAARLPDKNTADVDKHFDSETDSNNAYVDRENLAVSGGGGGGASGAASGGDAAKSEASYNECSLDELSTSPIFSEFIPENVPASLSFYKAEISDSGLRLIYKSAVGTIDLNFLLGTYGAGIDIETLPSIEKTDGHLKLAVNMGERYVLINMPSESVKDVYLMLKSCKYFN